MDKAREILLKFDEGLLSWPEVVQELNALVSANDISTTVAWGFALQIAAEIRSLQDVRDSLERI